MDLCGVKRVVESGILPVAAANGFHYIGAHPMAGLARVGWEYSRADLFENASMILVPHADTTDEVLAAVRGVVRDAGFGNVAISTADEHDYMIAYTSQLAHVLSSAYVKTPAAQRHRGFSAGSFRDMTRVAWLNEDMWTELFLDNPDYLAEEVEGLAARLLEYAVAIRHGDRENLRRLFAGRARTQGSAGGQGMKQVRIKTGAPYDVLIGGRLLRETGALVGARLAPCRAVLVTDSNVAPLYAGTVEGKPPRSGLCRNAACVSGRRGR